MKGSEEGEKVREHTTGNLQDGGSWSSAVWVKEGN